MLRDAPPIPIFLPMPIAILKKISISMPIPILACLTKAKEDTFLRFNEISQLLESNAFSQGFFTHQQNRKFNGN